VAPVVVPAGGFAIDGDLIANTPAANTGDWLPDGNGIGGVLDLSGNPLNPATTFHFIDPFNSASDNTFKSGKATDDPNTWQWTSNSASAKTDINNVLMHITTDANGHSWIIMAADRLSTSGASYIDFEFLQNSLTVNNDFTFTSTGPDGGRTVNDLLLTLMFTSGGSVADFAAFRWQGSAGVYTYVDATSSMPSNRVFVAANSGTINVPYGAFGSTTYSANAFAEAAIDLTALLGNFDPCLSIGVATIMVKTKVSPSGPASISDFINPIQYTLRIGPSSYAGPNQTRCSQGATTDFALQGQATQGLQPIASTTWSVVSGTATIDSTNSLNTTAHVSTSSATLRLTVIQSNGCTETSDVVLTVTPIPTCSIAGSTSVLPLSSSQFFAPAGMSGCSWSISGNGSISGSTNAQMITVLAGATCGANFTLKLNVTNNGCWSSCSSDVAVADSVLPSISAPADVVLECPADTSTNHNGSATASDNSGRVTVSYTDTVTPGCGGSKVISRLWTATDICGNVANATQKITVQDTTPPVVKAPANITIACGASLDPAVNGSLGIATATDGCSGASTPTYSDQNIAGNCPGNYTVKRTWSSVDACGNIGTALQTITVQDTTAPTLSGVPANTTVECTSVPAPASPTASDSCDPNPNISLVENSTQNADVTKSAHYNYTLTRTWTATDACGNHSSQSQVITVHDTTAPVLSGQGSALTIQCPATPSFTAPTASDNCDPNPQISFSDSTTPGTCAGNYSVTRTWTAKDATGNTSLPVSQTITVQDTTPPVLSGVPANVTVECSAVPAPAKPTASDLCDPSPGVSLVENSTQDADVTKPGHYNYTLTRTWTATDACGNHISQSQVITVQDTTVPVLSGQGPALTIQCPATPSFTAPKASDNCDPNPQITFSDSMSPGSCAGNYSVTRTWTAKDASGNISAPVSQTITVQDITPPALSGVPANTTVECNSVPAPASPTASDSCDPNPNISLAENSTQDPDVTKTGHYNYTLTRTWTATDVCGNQASQSQVITVHDTTAPVLSGQGPALTIQCPATPSFTAPGASDNCDPNPQLSFTDKTTAGNCPGNYAVTRTWTAKDVSGNVSLPVSQTITVQDITPPVLAGVPGNKAVECSAVPAPATPTASDTCDPNPSVSLVESSTQDSDATKSGHYNYTLTRTWTATDACGNHSSLSQVITVHDTTAPTLSGQGPALTIQCPATPSFAAPTASDNCDPNPQITFSDQTSAGNCAGNYTVTRTWTAKDVSGNISASVSQTITVQDVGAPALTGVPANITVECSAVPAPATPSANASCDPNPTVSLVENSTQDPDPTKLAHYNYTITRTWTATDACGNHISQSQVITVHDTTVPVLSGQGPALTIQCPATPSFTAPTASDNCDPKPQITFTDKTTPGSCAGNYSVTRTWTAKDVGGNVSLPVSQTITVQDVTAPTLAGVPANVTVECNSVPAPASPTATDSCDPSPSISLVENSTQDPDATKLAHYSYTLTRTWTATDACGNHASQSQVITVHDTTAPALTGQGIAQTIQCPATPVFTAPKASDNCDPNPQISFTDATTPGTCAGNYSVTRTWTAKDVTGNISLPVSQTITVQDTTSPALSGVPANVTVECSAVPSPATPTASDSCDPNPGVSLVENNTQDPDATKIAHYSYTLTRTWTATDACGNHASQSQVITVHDTTAPSLSGVPANTTVECSQVPPPATPTATDSCDPNPKVSLVETSTQDPDPTKLAHYNYTLTRTWTATDVSGNHSSQSQVITVHDTTAPVLNGQGPALTIQCPATPSFTAPTASDNCDPNPLITSTDKTTQGSCAGNYSVTRTWTAKDVSGNVSAPVSQTITVQDLTPPTLAGVPANVTVECNSVPAPASPTATDSCDPNPSISLVENSTQDPDATKLAHYSYTLTRTWTATDVCGNHVSQSQVITVHDTTAPVLTGQGLAQTIQCPATPVFTAPKASDNCDPNPQLAFSDSTTPGACSGTYSVTRTWTAKDVSGNISLPVSQTITVQDTTAPIVTPPANVTIACTDSHDPSVNIVLGVATALDGCSTASTPTYADQIVAGNCAGNYTIKRTWSSHDTCGNMGTALQTITVRDTTPPTVTAPPSLVLECPADTSTNATGVAVAQDGCDSLTLTYSDVVSNMCGNAKLIKRTWTAVDACGNTASALQTITLRDTTPPTITAPPSLVLECPASTATNNTGVAVAQDGCGSLTISYSDVVTNGCGNTKFITRTWLAADGCSNSATAVQTITLRDTTPPSFRLPANVVQQCPGDTRTNVTGVPVATDGCGSVTLSYSDVVSNSCGLTKTVWRTWTAVDQCGNATNGVQTISVIDTTAPTITCPNLSVQCVADVPVPYADLASFLAAGGTATDSCSPTLAFSLVSDSGVVGRCPGTVTRVYRATDACGNFGQVTQTITVDDTIPPVISGPTNAIVQCGTSLDPSNTGLATATDNCDTNVNITYSDSVVNSSSYSIKLYAADPNPSSGPYDPTYLKFGPGSLTPPVGGRAQDPLRNAVAYGPTSSTLDALTSMGSANLCLGQVVPYEAVIQVSGGPGIERGTIDFTAYWNTYTSSNNRFGYDTNYMIYAAFVDTGDAGLYDQNSNARVESFSSKVVNAGTINEAIQGTFRVSGLDSGDQIIVEIWVVLDSSMPDHTSGNIAAGLVSAQKDSNPPQPITTGTQTTVIGNIGKLSPLPAPQQQPPLPPPPPPAPSTGVGTLISAINRTWTATDACGNSSSFVQQITVRDSTPPALVVPPDMALQCPADTSTNNTGTATAQDACGSSTLFYTDTVTNGCGGTRVVSRLWTAVDQFGNTTNRVQTISVHDAPVVTAPRNITIACTDSLNPSINTALGRATATEGCSSPSTPTFADRIVPGNCAGSYTVQRTWSSVDACGNIGTALQTISVQDIVPPVVTPPANVTIACTDSPNPSVNPFLGVATAVDNCSAVSTPTYTDQVVPGNCAGNYTIRRMWSSSDACGNLGTALQLIAVRDTVGPVVSAPANATIACSDSLNPAANSALGVATAIDGCSGTSTPTYSDQIVAGNCTGNYTVRRTWTSHDGCGNIGTALQIITVQDTTPPTVTAPANLVLAFTADISTNKTGVATAQDTCSAVTLAYHDIVTIESDGTQVIARTWTATDACGNSASAVQTITLDAPAAPVLPNQTNVFLTDLTTLTVTNTATNPNVPANPLTYQLVNPPAGATIDSNGIITWTPTLNQSPSTNVFITVVSTTVTSAAGTSTVSATNTFVVIVSGPYDGIDLSNPTDALADTDGDGLSNLIEYSVGSDPRNSADADTGIIVWITQDSGNHYLAMKFKRRTNAASLGLQYFPEVSADKLSWAADNANVLQLSVDPLDSQFDWVTVRDVTPITPAAARFIHLRVVLNSIESSSPTWIGTDTTLSGNGGSGSRLTMFSQRMVLPIVYAGTVSSLQNTALTDTNASWTTGQFGNVATPAYAEFNNGWMVDISGSASSTKSLSLAGNLGGVASPGDAYRVRQHFTIASLFGTNNETGLKSGITASQADTILLQMAQSQATLTIFYYSNQFYHGWLHGNLSPADDEVVYPEEGVQVVRKVPGNVELYACGPIKTGVTVAPILPGYNLVGTLKSLSSLNLNALNLYTGDATTGLASGLTPSQSDNLLMIKPDGTSTTFFYYNRPGVFAGWVDGSLHLAGNVPVPAGSAFFIKRLGTAGQMNWTIPAE
jgi:hypothetical protein